MIWKEQRRGRELERTQSPGLSQPRPRIQAPGPSSLRPRIQTLGPSSLRPRSPRPQPLLPQTQDSDFQPLFPDAGLSPMGLDIVPQPDTRQDVPALAQELAMAMGFTALPSRAGRSSSSSIRSLSMVRELYWGCGTWRITRSTCCVTSKILMLCLPRATRRILAHDPQE